MMSILKPASRFSAFSVSRWTASVVPLFYGLRKICFLTTSTIIFCSGCYCGGVNFVGLTKEQVANRLEKKPERNDGSFRILYPLPDSSPDTMVHHFHKDKESLLGSQTAMNASKWQVFFHSDGHVWHSYVLTFKDGVVVHQEDRRQPHWTMAEP